jgi:parallel beta-helix repeat protein
MNAPQCAEAAPRRADRFALVLQLLAVFTLVGGAALPVAAAPTCVVPELPVPAPVCDGIADDQVALQAMLDAASNTRIPARIPVTPYGCAVSGPLCVKSDTVIIQDGLLKLSGHSYPPGPSQQYGIYTIVRAASNVTIMGNGTIDGGRPYPPPSEEPGGCCIGGIVAGGPVVGDYDAGISDVTVRGLTIRNVPTWALSIDGTDGVRVDRVTVVNSRFSPQVGHGSKNVIVSGLQSSVVHDIGFTFYRGISNAIVTNSRVFDINGGGGIGVFVDSPSGVAAGLPSKFINVNGNIVYDANGGIDVQSQRVKDTVGIYADGINVSNNLVHDNVKVGIELLGCAGCQVTGNQSHENGDPSVGYLAGISLAGAFGTLVSSNQVYDEGLRDENFYSHARAIQVREINCEGSFSRPTPDVVLCANGAEFPSTNLVAILANQAYDGRALKAMEAALDVNNVVKPVVAVGNVLGPVDWSPDISAPPLGSVFNNYVQP